MHPTARFPILIVGAGPVGLALALGLLQRGLAVLVFERRPKLAIDPRATTIQPPVLDILNRLGVLDQVASHGRYVDTLEYWDWTAPRRLASLPFAQLEGHTEFPWRMHCAQPDLCRVLMDRIEQLQPGTIQLGATVTAFTDQDDAVDIEVRQHGRTRKIRGAWLCAADGSKSMVRSSLGIELVPVGPADSFFTCEIGLDADAVHQQTFGTTVGDAAYLFTNAGWALWMRMPDSIRVLLLLEGGAPAMSDQGLQRINDTLFGWKNHVPLHSRALYKVQQSVAPRWHVGRTIILGDAAHMSFPVNGTAMNTGIVDGYTLSQVLMDGGDLSAWEQERIRDVTQRVNAYATKTYRQLAAHGLFSTETRNRYLEILDRGGEPAVHHLMRCSMLEGHASTAPELSTD